MPTERQGPAALPPNQPLAAPEVRWAFETGWQEGGPLDWAGVGAHREWISWSEEGPLHGPSHRVLLSPLTSDALAAVSTPPGGAATAHDALELALAGSAWLVRAAGLMFSPWSPVPGALASVAEAYGVGPELHNGEAALLRTLAWLLPGWHPDRGDPESAAELLRVLIAASPGPSPHRADLALAERSLVEGGLGVGVTPALEVLGAWPAAWWRARPSSSPPRFRVQSGALLFQPLDGGGFSTRPSDVVLPLRHPPTPPVALSRLLPPWTTPRRVLENANSPPGIAMPQDQNARLLFKPDEGTLLDLDSLKAINTVSEDLWRVMEPMLGDSDGAGVNAGLILDGLVPDGIPSGAGPPGSLEPTVINRGSAAGLSVRGGRALIRHLGRGLTVDVRPAPWVPLPLGWSAGQAAEVLLVLEVEVGVDDKDGPRFAREQLCARIVAVEKAHYNLETHLLVARSIPGARRWETDLAALWSPSDPRTARLVDQLGQIGELVWRAVPKGLVWDQAMLGRDWLRYQCAAAAALQAAGIALETRPMSTGSRVRLLEGLCRRLDQSVAEAADAARRLMGPAAASGPYGRALQPSGAALAAGGA